MRTDRQFYLHLARHLAERDRRIARFRLAGYPLYVRFARRPANCLDLSLAYFQVGRSTLRHPTSLLLRRHGVVPTRELLRDIQSICVVDSAIEKMLSVAAHAVRESGALCNALCGPKALPYPLEAVESAAPPTLFESVEGAYSPLPYAARTIAVSAVDGALLAIANAVKTYVDTHVTAAIRQQAGYNVRASLMIYIEPSQGVMPDNAHWRAWVRDLRAKRWVARTRVFGRNSERPVQIPTPLTLEALRLLHLEDHAPLFLAASRELERLRAIRAQARPLFELVRRFWAVPSSGNTEPSGAVRTNGGVGHPQGIDSTTAPARTPRRLLSESSYCNTAPQRARRQRHTKTHERVGT